MAITIGQQLGSLEVTALLGKGGMGEVYRARDTKLKRAVAIKILPDEFARDADRVNRFQREAEVLASLNHPNIAGIYDLQQTDETRLLVMELVEGETLADRVRRGSLPIDETLQIAKSICEALEAAHEQGIVHRDLKPANIKITPDGKVKVLDFGLAKAMEAVPATTFSNSPTLLSAAASNAGVILGTASYMSPEQAKGKSVDKRADIWAFGIVLYEMLTGRMLFAGETTTETMAAVMMKEPDWNELPPKTPPQIRELLRRCLTKDPRRRLQAIGDARIAIEDAHVGSAGQQVVGVKTEDKWQRIAWSLLAALILVCVGLVIRSLRETPAIAGPELRLEINMPSSITFIAPNQFALSPDGTRLALVALDSGRRIWVRGLNAVAAQPLAGTENALYPFWSPDSRSIGFFADGKLKRIDVEGGSSQTLADVPNGYGGTWNQVNTILFAIGSSIRRISATGGNAEDVTGFERGQGPQVFPQFLPDGRHFLYSAVAPSGQSWIYLASLDGGSAKRIIASDTNGQWVKPGFLLFMQQGTLRGQPFDNSTGTLSGSPLTVADHVSYSNAPNLGGFSASAGLIAYRSGTNPRTQLTWFDRTGKPTGRVGDLDESLNTPELSPDGRRVVFDRTRQNNLDIWIIDVQRGGTTRFTFDAAIDRRPLWSPDGSQVIFTTNRKNTFDLYMKPANGAGAEQLLLESPYVKTPDGWSLDGRFLLYNENSGKTSDVLALPMQGDRKPIPIANSPFSENNGQFSPDGRWVAYQSNESGRFEIYVVPFPPGAGKWQISTSGGIAPRWSHDGKELFFIDPNEEMMACAISVPGSSVEAASPVKLFQTRILSGGSNAGKQQYAVSADGHFLINSIEGDAGTAPITLIVNWRPPKP